MQSMDATSPALWLRVCALLLPCYVLSVLASAGCIRLCVWARRTGLLPPLLTRKAMHMLTGPAFCLLWLTFPHVAKPGEGKEGDEAVAHAIAASWSPLLASSIPLLSSLYFLAVGLGWWRDDGLVKAVARSGERSELLRGPLVYGLVHGACCWVYWTRSPVGVFLLLSLCLGDGSADVAGRCVRQHRPQLHRPLPWNPQKTAAGSGAMLAASLAGMAAFAFLFRSLDAFPTSCSLPGLLLCAAVVSTVCTAVESLPVRDWDNLTTTVAGAIAAQLTHACTATCSSSSSSTAAT